MPPNWRLALATLEAVMMISGEEIILTTGVDTSWITQRLISEREVNEGAATQFRQVYGDLVQSCEAFEQGTHGAYEFKKNLDEGRYQIGIGLVDLRALPVPARATATPSRVLHVNLKGGRDEGSVWIEAKLRVLGRQDFEIKRTIVLTLKRTLSQGLVWCLEGMVLARAEVTKALLLDLLFDGRQYFLEPEPWPNSAL